MMPNDTWSHAAASERDRFARSVCALDVDDCWIWVGGIEPDGGYGRFRPPGRQVIGAHRWSYLAHWGPTDWPVIRHRCDIRVCVNPHHLQAGTQAANITDTVHRGAWTPIAHSGPTSWPELAYTLRDAAKAGDVDLVRTLTARPRQLELPIGPAR